MLVLAALAALLQAPLPTDTLRPAGGPEIVWSRADGPLVALRLSVPLPPDLPTGAAELLQELARAPVGDAASRLGASVRFQTDPDHAALSVTGPAAAFDGLVAILRAAVAEPDLAIAPLRAARARAEDRVLADLERPEPRLRALLHARLHRQPATGPALDSLDAETIRGIRRRLYRGDRLRVILVGDLPRDAVRSAFADWPRALDPGSATADTAADAARPGRYTADLPPPQAHHAWAALGFTVDARPGDLLVAAELVGRRLRAAGLREGAAEAWFHDDHALLVVLGGAAPDDPAVAGAARITAFPGAAGNADIPALARFLRRMVAEAATLVGADAVTDAARSVRQRLLLDGATVSGRAALLDAGGPRAPVHDVLDRLQDVRLTDVRAILDGALARAPVLVEVRP